MLEGLERAAHFLGQRRVLKKWKLNKERETMMDLATDLVRFVYRGLQSRTGKDWVKLLHKSSDTDKFMDFIFEVQNELNRSDASYEFLRYYKQVMLSAVDHLDNADAWTGTNSDRKGIVKKLSSLDDQISEKLKHIPKENDGVHASEPSEERGVSFGKDVPDKEVHSSPEVIHPLPETSSHAGNAVQNADVHVTIDDVATEVRKLSAIVAGLNARVSQLESEK